MRANYYQFIILILSVSFISSCNSDNIPPTKSSVLSVQATSVSQSTASSSLQEAFVISSFLINISDLVIEENSGNDQEGDHEDGGNDKDEKDNGKSDGESESEDLLLTGPYTLDLSAGTATVDEVAVYPGTFKKIDFTFLPSQRTDFSGNSIVLEGTYANTDGTEVAVSLKSAFSQSIQIALPENGIAVADNSSVTFSIVLDAADLMANVDLSSAAIVDGAIIIDREHNADILNQFHLALEQLVEVED